MRKFLVLCSLVISGTVPAIAGGGKNQPQPPPPPAATPYPVGLLAHYKLIPTNSYDSLIGSGPSFSSEGFYFSIALEYSQPIFEGCVAIDNRTGSRTSARARFNIRGSEVMFMIVAYSDTPRIQDASFAELTELRYNSRFWSIPPVKKYIFLCNKDGLRLDAKRPSEHEMIGGGEN